ncbi:hypothetical protein DITRI_Ditri08aG0166700 [Diplodiscus trichospermus]
MVQLGNLVHGLKPPFLMVVVQVIVAGINVMYKLASNDGMSLKIVVAYRFIFAAGIMVPIALIVERKSLGNINWMVLFQAFLCGLLGMEKMAIRTVAGKAKLLGTLMGIGGAMIFTFYQGIDINIWSTNVNLLHHHQQPAGGSSSSHDTSKFILDAFLGLLSCISLALWLITQAKMSVKFPYLYSTTALMCVMGSIQSAAFALCTEKDWSQWKLGWNVRLLAVTFAGIVGSALIILISWGVHLKRPVYASIFNPLGLCFVAIIGSLLLGEKLHLGRSIIGGILIVFGLYVVLWGKAKEMKERNQVLPTAAADEVSDDTEEEYQNENKQKAEAVVQINIQP